MNTRLKIICILFGMAYLFVIGKTTVDSFSVGFSEDYHEGREAARSNKSPLVIFTTKLDFDIEPKAGVQNFPAVNLTDAAGQIIIGQARSLRIDGPKQQPVSSWLVAADILCLILIFPILGLFIYIPLQIYRLIRSIIRDEIFDDRNIRRLRKIGYSLLCIFGFTILLLSVELTHIKSLVNLQDYTVSVSFDESYIYILFGLTTLLFAEILKLSHKMKEEVDLTI